MSELSRTSSDVAPEERDQGERERSVFPLKFAEERLRMQGLSKNVPRRPTKEKK